MAAPTRWMEDEGYGAGYVYDYDAEGAFSGQDCFPRELGRHDLYDCREGREVAFADRLTELRAARSRASD